MDKPTKQSPEDLMKQGRNDLLVQGGAVVPSEGRRGSARKCSVNERQVRAGSYIAVRLALYKKS